MPVENHLTTEPTKARFFAIAFALVLPTAITWIYFVALSDSPDNVQKLAYAIGKTIQFGFPIVWVWKYSRIDLRQSPPCLAELISGLVSGLAIAVAMWVLFRYLIVPSQIFPSLQSAVREKITQTGLDSFAMYVGTGAFYAVMHSLLEEYYWRWFVFGQLSKSSVWLALTLSSLGFMAHHVIVLAVYFGWSSPLTYFFSLCIAIGGAGWAFMYWRFRTLFGIWLSHAIVDAAIFFIGYQMLKELLV